MEKRKLIQHGSSMNLLRALTSIDPWATDTLTRYASLPPQDDPDMEDLRIQALERQKAAAVAWHYVAP